MRSLGDSLQSCLDADLMKFRDSAVDTFAASRLRTLCLSKFLGDNADRKAADNEALAKFLGYNSKCEAYSYAVPAGEFEREFDNTLRFRFWKLFSSVNLDYSSLRKHWALGPGASVGCKTNDLYTKLFDGPLTGTSAYLYSRYKLATHGHPTHVAAEKMRAYVHGDFKFVSGSTFSCVEKNSNTSRVIGTEPLLNMFAQKVIAGQLTERLQTDFQINLKCQPSVNAELAWESSITGRDATIDLKGSSDLLSVNWVREFLPKEFYNLLMTVRSPNTLLPNGSWCKLHAVGGTGNAVTFPLQTLIYASIVRLCYDYLGVGRDVHVFGDDIICDERAVDLLAGAFKRYGFVINVDKSFRGNSPFRESCGGDFYNGVDVKPVYIRSLSERRDLISAFNRLRIWSVEHKTPLFRTLMFLRREIGHTSLYSPFLTDVGEGIWCTKEQALRRSAKHSRKHGENSGVVAYRISQVCVDDTNNRRKPSYINPYGEMVAACSGKTRCATTVVRAESVEQPACLQIHDLVNPKVVDTYNKRVTRFTSVWPDKVDAAREVYGGVNRLYVANRWLLDRVTCQFGSWLP